MHFRSDNQTGASDRVLEALGRANKGAAKGYGGDEWTEKAVALLKDAFECDLEAFFVVTGTAANSLALSCLIHPWQAVLCHSQAHILNDESTAPELYTGGARLVPVTRGEGKIGVHDLEEHFRRAGSHIPHNAVAAALSVTQAAENGLVYSPGELASLCEAAHAQGLAVHMDGARFANAVAALGCAPGDISWKAGVDVLCLGATKNGALAAEAVLFFRHGLSGQFIHRRKRGGHLLSKGRFFGAQFAGWLEGGHWLELAGHANAQAAKLARSLSEIPGIRLAWPVQANELFVILPTGLVQGLLYAGAEFYEWDSRSLPAEAMLEDHESLIRLVTSFATSEEEVERFCAVAAQIDNTL
jgi:threonine aldolase